MCFSDWSTYASHESFTKISNHIENLLSKWDANYNSNFNTNVTNDLYTINPLSFDDLCMMHLNNRNQTSLSTVSAYDIYIDIISNENIPYQDLDSYSSLICVSAGGAFNTGVRQYVELLDYDDTILPIVFPKATNIICDGSDTCEKITLYLTNSIDVYCRGIRSCADIIVFNAQNVYCTADKSCQFADYFNVVCIQSRYRLYVYFCNQI